MPISRRLQSLIPNSTFFTLFHFSQAQSPTVVSAVDDLRKRSRRSSSAQSTTVASALANGGAVSADVISANFVRGDKSNRSHLCRMFGKMESQRVGRGRRPRRPATAIKRKSRCGVVAGGRGRPPLPQNSVVRGNVARPLVQWK